ncbi:hypothetical protein GUJ93_ZPchr0008g13745 [Zizania palustris]|uniref:Uncharacterized protein n=1 Tax=Zizania palustris TaxID=103762 RepID=A0A8J5V3H4_ZIZPA|nr:hypothetical protein GUJ93_ZPchr0008g13745 [Zizania palustris]
MPYLVRKYLFFGDINYAIATLTVSDPNADFTHVISIITEDGLRVLVKVESMSNVHKIIVDKVLALRCAIWRLLGVWPVQLGDVHRELEAEIRKMAPPK